MEACGQTKHLNSKLNISGQLSIPICLPGGRRCIIKQRAYIVLVVTCFSSFMNLQRKNYQGGKNLEHASALAQILQIEKIAILFYIELHIQLL